MQYLLYKATSPSGKTYIGVTNNFKRRMKEHGTSPYTFGNALRKYGRENFHYEFELFSDVETALIREAELVTVEALQSGLLYNESVGGTLSDSLRGKNPMHDPEVVKRHPKLFSKEYNPLNDPEMREKVSKAQEIYKKKVSIDGIVYNGVREAARQLNSYRQFVIHRLKSSNYPTWFYVKN
jgi:predicted GIY-YIG superfamily endonuclease